MRIVSGETTNYIYFVAVDATDFVSRETGLATFTVYRSRNGGVATLWTTPTINETDATNMQGVYELLVDEDTTMDAGYDTQELVLHITHAGMAPVTRTIELYRPKITAGVTLGVESDGDLTKVNTLDGHTPQTGDAFARLGAPAGASIAADVAENQTDLNSILADTGTDIPATLSTIAGYIDTEVASIVSTLSTIDGKIDTVDGNVDAILVDTAEIGAAGAGLSAVPWNAAWDVEVQSECNDALVSNSLDHLFASATGLEVANSSILARLVSKSATPAFTDYDNQTDSLQAIRDRGDSAWITATSVTVSDKTGFSLASDGMDSVTLPADIITASSLAADAVQEIWTTTLTEAYAADGATFTGAQGMYMLWSALSEFAIDGTTITAKKLDGSTTSMTFTLDSSTAPTSRTRAT